MRKNRIDRKANLTHTYDLLWVWGKIFKRNDEATENWSNKEVTVVTWARTDRSAESREERGCFNSRSMAKASNPEIMALPSMQGPKVVAVEDYKAIKESGAPSGVLPD